jgi:hypothetical protein
MHEQPLCNVCVLQRLLTLKTLVLCVCARDCGMLLLLLQEQLKRDRERRANLLRELNADEERAGMLLCVYTY